MDMNSLMSQAKQMKKMIETKSKKFQEKEFIVEIQNIKILINGKYQIHKMEIDKNILQDKNMAEDLIPIAVNEAYARVKSEYKKYLGPLAAAPTGIF